MSSVSGDRQGGVCHREPAPGLVDSRSRAGLDPSSPESLAIIERIEALTPNGRENRAQLAERIDTFTDRRVFRYWTLVGIINGWAHGGPVAESAADAWEWYARALRAHA